MVRCVSAGWFRRFLARTSNFMGFIKYQFTSMKKVQTEAKWGDSDRCFYINSLAGQIRFKPKTISQLTRFRDLYINRIFVIAGLQASGKPVTRDLFRLYREIRKNNRVRYKANIHTRLKGLFFYAF